MRLRIVLSSVLALSLCALPAASQDDDDLLPITKIPSDEDLVPLPDLPEDLPPLPKLDPRSDGLRMDPEAMHNICLTQDIDDPNRIHFSVQEINRAVAELGSQIAGLLATDEFKQEGASGPYRRAIDRLFAQRDVLQICQLEEYSRLQVPRAMASCRGLMNATYLLDGPAVTSRKRGNLMSSEWLRMMEAFLPAARQCRRSLGQCLNPYNERQMKEYEYFLHFVVDVELISGESQTVSYLLPPCDATMIRMEDDKKPGDDAVEFIEKAPLIAPVKVEYDETPIIAPVTVEWGTP